MEERLQKYLARCGVASRRKCEELILNNRIKVNNETMSELGHKIDPDKDEVKFDNKIVKPEENKIYIALNKPTGYLSTVKDEKGRKTILDIVNVKERIYPIGRLDCDSSGLILLTNDGDIYNKVIHPKHIVNKAYTAIVKDYPDKEDIQNLCKGIDIGGYITAPAEAKIICKYSNSTKIKIIIHEGKNRQIRRMFDAINHRVIKLNRDSIGKINLDNIPLGKWRYLTNEEIEYVKNLK